MKPDMVKALDRLKAAQLNVSECQREILRIQELCVHEIVPDDPSWVEASNGVCVHCGFETGSWYCPKNPPRMTCEYPAGEWCVHCHLPSERL